MVIVALLVGAGVGFYVGWISRGLQDLREVCGCEPVFWNPYNQVTQCHRCGKSFLGDVRDAFIHQE